MHDAIGKYFIAYQKEIPIENFEQFAGVIESSRVIYEVIRIEESVPLFIEDYLNRMENSFQIIGKTIPVAREEIHKIINKLVKLNNHTSGPVKLILGIADNPLFLVYLMKPHLPKPEEYISGVNTILLKAMRSNPNAKIWNEDLRKKSIEMLSSSSAYEAILVDENDCITEASRSNVFFIRNNMVFTSPSDLVLPGITRMKVLEVCNKMNFGVQFVQVKLSELQTFDACFLTGTARKIVPVKHVDHINFNPHHPLLLKVSKAFDELVRKYIEDRV